MIDSEMNRALSTLSVTDNVSKLVAEVKPTKFQFDLKPGDKAMVMTNNNDMYASDDYRALVTVEVLDPEEYKAMWPDYQDRLQGSWVLTRFINADSINDGGSLGWFGRVELMPLTQEEVDQIEKWMTKEEEAPEENPDWLSAKYVVFADTVAVNAPDKMIVPSTCESCGSRKMKAQIKSLTEASCFIGEGTVDGIEGTVFLPISDIASQRRASVELHCQECQHVKVIQSHQFVTRGKGPLFSHRETIVPRDQWS